MPEITGITHVSQQQAYAVRINGTVVRVRDRTFPAMGLQVGDQITPDQLRYLDNYHWKLAYASQWEAEKYRLDRIAETLEQFVADVEVVRVGFGADTVQFIPEHPDESGAPDLAVRHRPTGRILCMVEVTGTERKRGGGYWVRPDKLTYANRHPDPPTWIVLHYAQPEEHVRCIQPDPDRQYEVQNIPVRGIERYVVFPDNDPDLRRFRDLVHWLELRIQAQDDG